MVSKVIKNIFLYSAGHTYSNLSRLFLRLFAGLMFLQFGLRQILHMNEIAPHFEGFLSLSPDTSLILIAAVELLCASFIMLGFLMRIAIIPSLAMMCWAEYLIFVPAAKATHQLFAFQPGYPVMMIGIFIFLLLAGPGKVSVDYLIAAIFDREKEEDEVLEQA